MSRGSGRVAHLPPVGIQRLFGEDVILHVRHGASIGQLVLKELSDGRQGIGLGSKRAFLRDIYVDTPYNLMQYRFT